MTQAELTRALKSRAVELGFDACAVARADPLERDGAALAAWLAADRHATMAWMARSPETRSDPERLLPGCRSVIVTALDYWPGEADASVPADRAKVALYARGRDYHKVVGRKLRELTLWLAHATGGAARSFVDTGPVLERAWAERAGVGWIGKNANLLTRTMGSWILLGEILTTVDLVPDQGPHADFCGTCTACIGACPTGAIVEPGIVDSRLCISYWTIEHRGAIPEDRRDGIGTWIFGCDVCQDVCPWNRSFAAGRDDDPLERSDDLRGLDPVEVLTMDERTFRERFSGTALMRAKWEGLRRNACIVLGNRRDSSAVTVLESALADADPVVRAHAEWALRKIATRT